MSRDRRGSVRLRISIDSRRHKRSLASSPHRWPHRHTKQSYVSAQSDPAPCRPLQFSLFLTTPRLPRILHWPHTLRASLVDSKEVSDESIVPSASTVWQSTAYYQPNAVRHSTLGSAQTALFYSVCVGRILNEWSKAKAEAYQLSPAPATITDFRLPIPLSVSRIVRFFLEDSRCDKMSLYQASNIQTSSSGASGHQFQAINEPKESCVGQLHDNKLSSSIDSTSASASYSYSYFPCVRARKTSL